MQPDRVLMMAVMKSRLPGPFVLLLILLGSSAVSGLGSVLSRYFWSSQAFLTWQGAQDRCRSHHASLATYFEQSEIQGRVYNREAWVGLHKETTQPGLSGWSWINTDGFSKYYKHWGHGEPDSYDRCASFSYNTLNFSGHGCDKLYPFICQTAPPDSFKYKFIPQAKTWSEAQQYCQDKYHDLAVFQSIEHTDDIPEDFLLWIGLHREGTTWKWAAGASDHRQWAPSNNSNNGDCVTISLTDKDMATEDCSSRLPFVCMKDNLVLVKENKTWEEALEHCRSITDGERRHELLSVQPGQDQRYMMYKVTEADTEEVWVGLRFLAGYWLWVNGDDVLYPGLPLCPLHGQSCGVLSKNNSVSVETSDCMERRNFLCYKV
ncbi:macrophage mannose receptor 1-like [Embiotoca jacksoni]|uniref:macrophage mannose receptor 1-like n=2 Tax=Embiotoca jacksoni TaxID=100190 RepID=UPI0037047651